MKERGEREGEGGRERQREKSNWMIHTSLQDHPLPLKRPMIGNGRHINCVAGRMSRIA